MAQVNKLTELEKVIRRYSPNIDIFTPNGKKIGCVPEIHLRFLDYYNKLSNGLFSREENKMILLDNYTKEKRKFFCFVMAEIPYRSIKLEKEQYIWFFEICDEYGMDEKIIGNALDSFSKSEMNMKMFFEIAKLYHKKIMGPAIKRMYLIMKYKIVEQYDVIDIVRNISRECFHNKYSKKMIYEAINKGKCMNETKLFNEIISRITEINTFEHKLSLDTISKLLDGIKWFYVRYDSFEKLWIKLINIYPELVIPYDITKTFSVRLNSVKIGHHDKYKDYPLRPGISYTIKPQKGPNYCHVYSTAYHPHAIVLEIFSTITQLTCFKNSYFTIKCKNADELPSMPIIHFRVKYSNDSVLDEKWRPGMEYITTKDYEIEFRQLYFSNDI